jgi:predicted nucleic acid-binding protein
LALLLDTGIAILLRVGDPQVTSSVGANGDVVLLSIMTQVELEGGVYRDPAWAAVRRARLDVMLRSIPVAPFDDAAATAYRGIVQACGYSRRKLLDRMIAAQALVLRAVLITRNPADVSDVPGLPIEVW